MAESPTGLFVLFGICYTIFMAGNIQVGTLYRKSILRDLSGNIINLRDDADGGWIIQNRRVVNQEKLDELAKKEEDKRLAAQAESMAVQAPVQKVEERSGNPSKMKELEEKVSGMESKLDAILSALKK